MKSVQAIFFDLDDTLIDNDGSYQISIARLCAELGAEHGIDAPSLRGVYDDISNRFWTEDPATAAASRQIRCDHWQQTLSACGLDGVGLGEATAIRYETYRRETISTFADTHVVLKSLAERCPLALITNGAADGQIEKLVAASLLPYFRAVLISGEVSVAKPDPAIFRLALDKLELTPEGVWHIGDSLQADVAGAKASGLTAVWLNRRGAVRNEDDPSPDHEIGSLAALSGLLD